MAMRVIANKVIIIPMTTKISTRVKPEVFVFCFGILEKEPDFFDINYSERQDKLSNIFSINRLTYL